MTTGITITTRGAPDSKLDDGHLLWDREPEEWMGGVAERVEFVGYRELIELRRQSRKSRGAA